MANVFAVEKINQAKGEAAAMTEGALPSRSSGSRALRRTRTLSCCGSKPTGSAPGLTKFRLQLETLEDVLPGMRKFVRPGSGEVKDFDLWLVQPLGSGQGK